MAFRGVLVMSFPRYLGSSNDLDSTFNVSTLTTLQSLHADLFECCISTCDYQLLRPRRACVLYSLNIQNTMVHLISWLRESFHCQLESYMPLNPAGGMLYAHVSLTTRVYMHSWLRQSLASLLLKCDRASVDPIIVPVIIVSSGGSHSLVFFVATLKLHCGGGPCCAEKRCVPFCSVRGWSPGYQPTRCLDGLGNQPPS